MKLQAERLLMDLFGEPWLKGSVRLNRCPDNLRGDEFGIPTMAQHCGVDRK